MLLSDFTLEEQAFIRHKLQVKTVQSGKCRLWRGKKKSHDYGQMYVSGRLYLVHRLSALLRDGEVDDNLKVCHECDTPSCVAWDCLFIGTQADNIRDMMQKGRHASGINPLNIAQRGLSQDQALEARRRYAAGGVSQPQLASEYGVSRVTMGKVLRGECYKDITRGTAVKRPDEAQATGRGKSLAPQQIAEVQRLAKAEAATAIALAERFGVHQRTIRRYLQAQGA